MKHRNSLFIGHAKTACVFLCAVLFSASFAANPYVELKSSTVWSFFKDDKRMIVKVTGQDTIAGKKCYKIEWHPDNGQAMLQTEYWFEKSDSIFCQGVKAFGSKIAYVKPGLVVAKSTKPGDQWKIVLGAAPFGDTVIYKAEGFDTVLEGSEKTISLHISRKSRGANLDRWFGLGGKGIMREETMQKNEGLSLIKLKENALK